MNESWGMTYTTEQVMAETRCSRQHLKVLRYGHRMKQYDYRPVVKEGVHWRRDGYFVQWSQEGMDFIKNRREKRDAFK
jgi:hypothetical protein